MKECILHYIWQYKLFAQHDLYTTDGQSVEVIDVGKPNIHAGPDFFNAKIKIGKTIWAGNVEIHNLASDWNRHAHQGNKNYGNVILHVVKKADVPVFRSDGQKIPQLELNYAEDIEQNYQALLATAKWIACEDKLKDIAHIYIHAWKHVLMAERMEQKVKEIDDLLQKTKGHWEEAFFLVLCKHFGFSVNNDAFFRLATSTSWQIVRKCSSDLFQLEALLFGQSGLLHGTITNDDYICSLKREYEFLKRKFKLQPMDNLQWRLLRLRPDNFPHIRIAQLASLLFTRENLFSYVINNQEVDTLVQLFITAEVSDYWQSHYLPGGETHTLKPKKMGLSSVYSLLINVVAPMLFCYGEHKQVQELKERALTLLDKLPPENNHITRKWKAMGMEINSASDSQAFIYLYKNYCEEKKCLRCRMGHQILAKTRVD